MDKATLDSLVKEIKTTKKSKKITPRQLFSAFDFYRRTSGNCYWVDKYLKDNNLEVIPHYNDVWVDTSIIIKEKDKATRKVVKDPVRKLQVLEAANREPIFLSLDADLVTAITEMRIHNYSQLPITKNGKRGVCGYISWQTIGEAKASGVTSNDVRDYISTNIITLPLNTPLLDAVEAVYKNTFIVVKNEKEELCGMVTTTDLSSQFLTWTKPFILLEEIENQLRQLLDDKFYIEDLKQLCQDSGREVKSIDDLTFGEYLRLIENPKNWNQLSLIGVDKGLFQKQLEEVRKIRNDVMHFEPEGLTDNQTQTLIEIANFLRSLTKYQQEKI